MKTEKNNQIQAPGRLAIFSPAQKGVSMGSLLLNLVLIVFMALMIVKVGGLYLDNITVNKRLQSLDDVPFLTKKSPREVADILKRQLDMDNVSITYDEMFIDRRSDRLIVEINYERRVHLISNIDIILVFENSYETVNR